MWRAAGVDRLSDEALLAAIAVDDADAATVFVRRFQRRVFGVAMTITGDPSVAEDVAQQTFERAWRHAATYDARRAGVATWLLTITRNLAIDTIRVRRPPPLDPAMVSELLSGADDRDPADRAVASDLLHRLRASLVELPVEQQRAVVLATILSRTSTEIAEIEGIPIPTAKHRIQSGLRKLRLAVVEQDQ